jgi:hypothetical protein
MMPPLFVYHIGGAGDLVTRDTNLGHLVKVPHFTCKAIAFLFVVDKILGEMISHCKYSAFLQTLTFKF